MSTLGLEPGASLKVAVGVKADVHIIVEDDSDTVEATLDATGDPFREAAEGARLDKAGPTIYLAVTPASPVWEVRSGLGNNTFNGPVVVQTGSGCTQSVHFGGGGMDVRSGDGDADGDADGSLKITIRVPSGVQVDGIVLGDITVSGSYDRNLFTIEPRGGEMTYL
ncbi:hypothetical protein ACQPZP_02770 [Spirillospora sp. CA-142024]|uniref:hypothetical protein n=1 Tax=Spirillospora sp. CA-142024 TaxID=3240036 RepID=UPI003D8A2F0F